MEIALSLSAVSIRLVTILDVECLVRRLSFQQWDGNKEKVEYEANYGATLMVLFHINRLPMYIEIHV